MGNNKTIKQYLSNGEIDINIIIDEYAPYVFVIIKNSNYKFNNEDVEEIASDVFLTVWKNRNKLNINKEMSPYIAGVTKKLMLKKNRIIMNENVDIDEVKNTLYIQKDIVLQTEEKDRNSIILNELDRMTKEDENIFTYYYYYSYSMKEISKKLKISEKKVKSRLFRIRKKLKKELEKWGYSYGG